MTLPEVAEEINAYYEMRSDNEKRQKQLRALMDYQFAQLIGIIIHNPKKYPKTLSAAYPDLFSAGPRGWRESKAQWQKYAAEFNQRRGEKK